MPSITSSLAFACLGWCLRDSQPELAPESVAGQLENIDSEALAGCSRSAVREAARELLAALPEGTSEKWISKVSPALLEYAALPALDALLGGNTEDWAALLDTPGEERGVVVAARLVIWLRARASGLPEPADLDRLLAFGWLEAGTPPRSVTFYQAYCRSLHREARAHSGTLDATLLALRIDPGEWTSWLAEEAGLPSEAAPVSRWIDAIRWHPPTVAAVAASVIALVTLLIWRPWSADDATPPREVATHRETPAPAAETNAPPAVVPPPAPAPEKSTTASLPPVAPPLPVAAPPQPANPIERASALMDAADKALAAGREEEADAAARTAQEVLEEQLPTRNALVGDELSRVGMYLDNRERWTESVRVHEKAVKCYEKTPAENAAPQLDAVNRWASALRQCGRHTEAERLFRTLLQAYEGTGPALEVDAATVAHNLANVMASSGRRKEARGFYERALSLMSEHWRADEQAGKLAGVMAQNYQTCLVALGFTEDKAASESRRLLKLPTQKRTR